MTIVELLGKHFEHSIGEDEINVHHIDNDVAFVRYIASTIHEYFLVNHSTDEVWEIDEVDWEVINDL